MEIANDEARVRLYEILADLFKILKNPTRLRILELLLIESPQRFTDMMFELRKNPNVLTNHLKSLQKYEMVEKTEEELYQITDIGKIVLKADLKSVIKLVEEILDLEESAV